MGSLAVKQPNWELFREAAEAGLPDAAYVMAVCSTSLFPTKTCQDIPQDDEAAVAWLRLATGAWDFPEIFNAQASLARCLHHGVGTPVDFEAARTWYTRASAGGDASSAHNLGVLDDQGQGGPVDHRKAAEWFQLGAQRGLALSQLALARYYHFGTGLPQDPVKAVAWFKLAAEQGNVEAQVDLGKAYYYAINGVVQNYTEAVKWLTMAAAAGGRNGLNTLGVCHTFGLGVPQSHCAALGYYLLSAERGHSHGYFNLGCVYQNGHCVEKDASAATSWFRKAALAGDTSGQLWFGLALVDAQGIAADASTGFSWVQKAAVSTDSLAQYHLGRLYADGTGVAQNTTEAVHWFRLAANQGVEAAQLRLAYCYEHGIGVDQDLEAAARWKQRAQAEGEGNAGSEGEPELAVTMKLFAIALVASVVAQFIRHMRRRGQASAPGDKDGSLLSGYALSVPRSMDVYEHERPGHAQCHTLHTECTATSAASTTAQCINFSPASSVSAWSPPARESIAAKGAIPPPPPGIGAALDTRLTLSLTAQKGQASDTAGHEPLLGSSIKQ